MFFLSQRRTALLLLPILFVAIISPSSLLNVDISNQKSTSNNHRTVPEGQSQLQSLPRLGGHAPLSSSDPPIYDEQLGISFTQDFYSLACTVTAVGQSDNDGYGPAYLLNGLTDQGWWYQVGLAYNWPYNGGFNAGFNFIYEVWDSSGNSIFPTNGGGGILAFSGPVYEGDNVFLKLYFLYSEVVMWAMDNNTGAIAYMQYSAEGATIFSGTPSGYANLNDFFTGLMTEWYHTNPYYGDEQEVVYFVYGSAISSAWMWIDEFNSQNLSVLFSDYTFVPYTNPTQLQTLSSNGATVSSDAYEFITGSLSSVALTLSYSIADGGYGYTAPVLTYILNGAQQTAAISNSPTTYYVDIGTSWSITNPLSSSTSTERWQTDQPTSGTAYSPETMNLVYYHQYSVIFGYNINGGGSGYSAPTVTYQEFGSQVTATTGTQVWADSSQYHYPDSLPGSSYAERWATNSGSGLVSSSGSIITKYYHQYLTTASYSVIGGGTPVPPTLTSTAFGSPFSQALTTQPHGFWMDNGVLYSVTNPLSSSTDSERWRSNSALEGNVSSSFAVSASYYHQYYVSIEPNPATGGSVSVGSDWFDAGATFQATASANAGWQFEGWNGSGDGSYSGASNTASTVAGAPLVETATFYPGLTIVSSSGISVSYIYGATAGSVPAGTSQTIFAPQGTDITLAASPTLFIYSFEGWTGSTTSGGSMISAVLNSPMSLTANYSFNYVNIGIMSAIVIAAVTVFAITIRRVKGGSHQRRRGPRHLHDKKSKV
jgi:hypothetical protein